MRVAGIDPGIKGAVGLIDTENKSANEVFDLPITQQGKRRVINGYALSRELERRKVDVVVIESVHAMPGQGVVSMFTFGYNAGIILGVCQALGLKVEFVMPAVWKRVFKLIGKSKEASRALATRKWPALANWLKLKKHQDRAEALLIAMWYAVQQRA